MNQPQPNDLWYTPEYILKAVREHYGEYFGMDLFFDPCPINPQFNGLEVPWRERCFINPPYSKALKRAFVHKGEIEFAKGGVEHIWLVNYANSQDLRDLKAMSSAVCLPHQRVQLIPGHESLGDGGSPRYDNIIIYCGGNPSDFCKNFKDIGACYESKSRQRTRRLRAARS